MGSTDTKSAKLSPLQHHKLYSFLETNADELRASPLSLPQLADGIGRTLGFLIPYSTLGRALKESGIETPSMLRKKTPPASASSSEVAGLKAINRDLQTQIEVLNRAVEALTERVQTLEGLIEAKTAPATPSPNGNGESPFQLKGGRG